LDAAIWGLIGTITGAFASIATTSISIKSNRSVQEIKSKEERQERASAFQKDTLFEIQQSLHDTLRLVHRAYIEDYKAFCNGTPWSKATLSDELSESTRLAASKMSILVERITDDELRLQVKTLMKIAHQATLATDETEATEQLLHCQAEANRLFESLGNALRSHY
jgi:hypothetical protein